MKFFNTGDAGDGSLFDIEREKTPFFSRLDWSAFATATAVSFLVYFFTLAPTVTLEDSGELAVAGDHLGVPHPPGYPLWTMISWCFARMFSWVTFRGQPTPAWSIALGGSAVFGAIAAGLTAMLITRSGMDMLRNLRESGGGEGEGEAQGAEKGGAPRKGRFDAAICWSGGVASSLLFAFSPVMWSQATICEVYALNAFFLMMVMLLTYRWMRRPTPGLLWITAFVFGLGLTNYQVLLLAIVPLVIVIFLRDLRLFRDFMLAAIPMLLMMWILQLGSLLPTEGFPKHNSITGPCTVYSPWIFFAGLAVAGIGLVAAVVAFELEKRRAAKGGVAGDAIPAASWVPVGIFCLGALLMVASRFSEATITPANVLSAPLVDPRIYMNAATCFACAIGACVSGVLLRRGRPWSDPAAWVPVAVLAAAAIFLFAVAGSTPAAGPYVTPPGQIPAPPFEWGKIGLGFAAATVVLFALACTARSGVYYAIGTSLANLALLYLLRRGALLGLTHPSTWWFWAPVCLSFVYLALAWICLPYGRTVALSVLAVEAGVAFYGYMPIVSDLRNPPMNWGYPRTWEGFKHAITRGQYEKIAPTDIFSGRFMRQIGSYFTDLRTQFTMLLAPLGFLPFAVWRFRTPRGRFRMFIPAFVLFAVSGVFVLLAVVPGIEAVFDRIRVDKWIVGAILAISAFGGALIAFSQYGDLVERVYRRREPSEAITLGVTILGLAGVAALFCMRGFYSAFEADDPVLRASQNLSLLSAAAAAISVAVVAAILVGLPILRRRAREHAGLDFAMDSVNQQWMIATVAAFLMMSVMLTVLANPKGDLQDTFIQKVKFISSHGLYAIWIGYGAIFSLFAFDGLASRLGGLASRAATAFAIVAVCLLPVIPIHENYRNERLVFELGGAEQNGHDYGWQFGNFQLRGADAIDEELEPDEEPLPNPYYPPEMTPNAVFFGGTDPGRFVPTYMIYSALVRPDVFIITQNALADNTYMSVERDLYGDDMWIPTPDDSARAFSIYVEEVNAGKRPRNADLVIDHGRVQVSGALGVMEINGILCEMMFNRNKALHDFYVEESYVIQWMYPYLTPHGLILKLNAEKTDITPENTRDDMDFWDWYSRRLVYSKNFRRDVVAQKSFSKLRSAIAGCYVFRNRPREAERAFSEARLLYSASPEAAFRMAQDIYMRARRYEDAIDMLNRFLADDPNNDRAAGFRDYLVNVVKTEARLQALARSVKPGEHPSPETIVEMAECYADLGNSGMVGRCIEQLLATAKGDVAPQVLADALALALEANEFPVAARVADRVLQAAADGVSPELALGAARAYNATGQQRKMAAPLMRLLKANPEEWRGWVLLGVFYASRDDASSLSAARDAFSRGVSIGGAAAKKLLTDDPAIYKAFEKAHTAAAPAQFGAPGDGGAPAGRGINIPGRK